MVLQTSSLFNRPPEFLKSFDFIEVVQGQAYIQFFGGAVGSASTGSSILEGLQTGDDEDNADTGLSDWVAQTFTPSEDLWVTKTEVYGRWDGPSQPGDPIFFIVRMDGDDDPDMNEMVLNLGTYSPGFDADNAWIGPDVTNYVKLRKNVKYALVVDMVQAAGSENNYVRIDGSSPTYTGDYYTSADSGANWTKDSTKDMLFRISGITTNPKILFSKEFDTNENKTSGALVAPLDSSAFYKRIDVDYDLEVGRTILMKGKTIINMTVLANGNVSSFYAIAKIVKESGGTETVLATGQGSDLTGGTTKQRIGILADISSLQILKSGDILRLRLEVWIKASGAITNLDLYQDPFTKEKFNIQLASNDGEDQRSGTESSIIALIPFKVDLT